MKEIILIREQYNSKKFQGYSGRSGKNEKGIWSGSLKIKPGHYEYKLIVDGKKIRDPNNRLYAPNGNSILNVKPFTDK